MEGTTTNKSLLDLLEDAVAASMEDSPPRAKKQTAATKSLSLSSSSVAAHFCEMLGKEGAQESEVKQRTDGQQGIEAANDPQDPMGAVTSKPPQKISSEAVQVSEPLQDDEQQPKNADIDYQVSPTKAAPTGPSKKIPAPDTFVINIESDEPEGICTRETPTREVFARPGPASATAINFRGWIIADIDPNKAETFAKDHLYASRKIKEHVIASITSTNGKDGQAVGVVCFGDLDQNLDRGLVTKVIFPFKIGDDVLIRELAAIRHAFTEGFALIEEREEGAGGINATKIKVKTFSVVTTSIAAVKKVREYKSLRSSRQFKLCYKLDTLLRDICEISSDLAERDVKTCLYYAPDDGTAPLTLAAINASFMGEIEGMR